MNTNITITPASGTWVVRAGGAVIGETTRAMELLESGCPPVIYFPREDVEMAFLDATDYSMSSPSKGEASYYSIVAKSGSIDNVAWSYENPPEDMSRIAGHLAFHAGEKVTVERL